MEMNNVLFAFLLTLFACPATGIGSALALLTKKTSPRFLSIAPGFSAGVMLHISFSKIMGKANVSLAAVPGRRPGARAAAGGFFAGSCSSP